MHRGVGDRLVAGVGDGAVEIGDGRADKVLAALIFRSESLRLAA